MTEVEAVAAVPNEEEDKDEADEIYSDPNGKFSQWTISFAISIFLFVLAAVIVSFLDQFGATVFNDKPPIMSDLMEWLSSTDEGESFQ